MRYAAWGIAAAVLLAPAAGLADATDDAEEVLACVRENLPERTSIQRLSLRARDRAGSERTLECRMHWKRTEKRPPRVRIRVDEPPDMRGATYLLIDHEDGREADMFVHIPAVGKVRRVTAQTMSDSLWGTDFSYEDIRQLQRGARDQGQERLEDATYRERPVYVLAFAPRPEDHSSYERIVSSIDSETCVVMRVEFFESGNTLRKRLEADPESLVLDDGRWLARKLEMHDLRDETRSWLEILEVKNDVEIRDRTFNPTFLDKGH